MPVCASKPQRQAQRRRKPQPALLTPEAEDEQAFAAAREQQLGARLERLEARFESLDAARAGKIGDNDSNIAQQRVTGAAESDTSQQDNEAQLAADEDARWRQCVDQRLALLDGLLVGAVDEPIIELVKRLVADSTQACDAKAAALLSSHHETTTKAVAVEISEQIHRALVESEARQQKGMGMAIAALREELDKNRTQSVWDSHLEVTTARLARIEQAIEEQAAKIDRASELEVALDTLAEEVMAGAQQAAAAAARLKSVEAATERQAPLLSCTERQALLLTSADDQVSGAASPPASSSSSKMAEEQQVLSLDLSQTIESGEKYELRLEAMVARLEQLEKAMEAQTAHIASSSDTSVSARAEAVAAAAAVEKLKSESEAGAGSSNAPIRMLEHMLNQESKAREGLEVQARSVEAQLVLVGAETAKLEAQMTAKLEAQMDRAQKRALVEQEKLEVLTALVEGMAEVLSGMESFLVSEWERAPHNPDSHI